MRTYSYALIVAAICYSPVSGALVAAYTDNAGALVAEDWTVGDADECEPPTERSPVSPIVVRERPIVVEVSR